MKDGKRLDSAAPFWVIDAAVEFQSWFDGGFGGRRHWEIGLGWVGLEESYKVLLIENFSHVELYIISTNFITLWG